MLKSLSTVAVAALLAFSVAGCTTSEQRTAGYGVGGAALGGVAVGAATANNDGRRYCTYENRYGERYRAPCRGY